MNNIQERQQLSISRGQLVASAIVWLALPLILFLTTWIKPIIGWPLALAVSVSLFRCVKNMDGADTPAIYINRSFWIMVVLIFLFTVYTGIGGLFYQDYWDHGFRNAIFQELVDNPWPVVKNNPESGEIELFCYYHAFWLPAAVVAKMSGSITAGNMVQLFYAFAGLVMTALLVFDYLKFRQVKIWCLLFLAFYCGWDIVLFPLWANYIDWEHRSVWQLYLFVNKDLPWWNFSAPALPALTLYIYNQGIAAWLSVSLLLSQRDNFPMTVLLYSLLFLFAPIPAVGLLPAMIYWTLLHFRKSLSVENMVGVLVFIVVGLYFMSNNQAKNPTSDNGMTIADYIWKCGLFLLSSYVVYFPYTWRWIKKDWFFWIMLVTAAIIPFFVLSGMTDLGCRVGIPVTFYLALIVLKSATKMRDWSKLKITCFALTFAIGFITTSGMYGKNLVLGYRCILSGRPFQSHWIPTVFDAEKCGLKNNFVASGESIFTKYLMERDAVAEMDDCVASDNEAVEKEE